jgi:hypothetical protein
VYRDFGCEFNAYRAVDWYVRQITRGPAAA